MQNACIKKYFPGCFLLRKLRTIHHPELCEQDSVNQKSITSETILVATNT